MTDGSGEGPLDKPKVGGMVRLETEAGQLEGKRPSGEKPGVGVHADMLIVCLGYQRERVGALEL